MAAFFVPQRPSGTALTLRVRPKCLVLAFFHRYQNGTESVLNKTELKHLGHFLGALLGYFSYTQWGLAPFVL